MECYGHYGETDASDCADCEFLESCKYYTGAAENAGTKRHTFSLDARTLPLRGYWCKGIVRSEPGLPDTYVTLRDLAGFAQFLFSLDDYALGVLGEVIRGAASISDLANAAGVSKQCVHRKVTDVISRVPELTELFVPLMPKLTAARRQFLLGGGKYPRKRGKRK